jgi:hypothetical protein
VKLFNIFKNPDKETVLTPWRVVNMHLADTIGGYRWVDNVGRFYGDYDDNIATVDAENAKTRAYLREAKEPELIKATPKWVEGKSPELWQNKAVKFLEINSKTALCPLYLAASIFLYCKKLILNGVKTVVNCCGKT